MGFERIVVDSDGIITDFHGKLIFLHNKRHGTNWTIGDITEWKLPPGMKETFVNTPGFFLNMELIHGAKEGLDWIASRYDLVIATSPAGEAHIAKDKLLFFEKYLPAYRHSVVVTERKDIFSADLIIDDAPHFIEKFPGHRIVMDYPWNQGIGGVCWPCHKAAVISEHNAIRFHFPHCGSYPKCPKWITARAVDWADIVELIKIMEGLEVVGKYHDKLSGLRNTGSKR